MVGVGKVAGVKQFKLVKYRGVIGAKRNNNPKVKLFDPTTRKRIGSFNVNTGKGEVY